MKTKKPAEKEEADRLEFMILALGASDFRPGASQYAAPPSEAQLEWAAEEDRRQARSEMGTEGHVVAPTDGVFGVMSKVSHNLPGVMAWEYKKIDPAEVQRLRTMGLVRYGSGTVCRVRGCRIDPSGAKREVSFVLTEFPPPGEPPLPSGAWHIARLPGVLPEAISSDGQVLPGLVGVAWRAIFENWSVQFWAGVGVPCLRLPACADSVKGLFRLRDKDSGLNRRAALRHWVRDHRRKKPDGEQIDIAGHLRGAETFDWFGMKCRVHAPARLNGPPPEAAS